jgi:hypothetical protein
MKIHFQPTSLALDRALCTDLRRLVLLALASYAPQIGNGTCRLVRLPVNTGGGEWNCRSTVRLKSGRQLSTEGGGEMAEAAVLAATASARRWVQCEIAGSLHRMSQ